jgi:1-acyl-sn-glycerol-3-phosphate acyltransferase
LPRLLPLDRGGPTYWVRRGWWRAIGLWLSLYHRLEVEGREHLPPHPPFVLVSNHASHLDAVVLLASLPSRLRHWTHPLAAEDVFFRTSRRAYLATGLLNALPLPRGRCGAHCLGGLRRRLLGQRCCYILFPEGTRTRTGEMGVFKPGLGVLVAGTNVPVVPCHLTGTFTALAPGSVLPRPNKVRLRFGSPLSFAETPARRPGWEEVARRTEEAVWSLAGEPICI